jgi:predicted DNA-binding transcriptional regulator AlpA
MTRKTKQPAHATVRHPSTPALPTADPLVTVAQAARALGISDFLVDRLIEQGKLPQPIRFTPNGRRYLRTSAAQGYIDSMNKPQWSKP